jgi:hypothetical protein
VRDPLDPSQNFHSVAPGCMALADPERISDLKSVSIDFELVQPETVEYFSGLFRRAGNAWSLGYAIARMAGLPEE